VIEFGHDRIPGGPLGVLVDLGFPALGHRGSDPAASIHDRDAAVETLGEIGGERPALAVDGIGGVRRRFQVRAAHSRSPGGVEEVK
jgi:hypothetical protein